MDKYLELAVMYHELGCTVEQAVGIAQDAKKEDERRNANAR